MTTRSLQSEMDDNSDGRLDQQYLKRHSDEFPFHQEKIDGKIDNSSGILNETVAIRSVKQEHEQHHVQGRRDSSNRTRSSPSRFSSWDLESTGGEGKSEKTRKTKKILWGSNSRWWEYFPGARIGGAFGMVLLVVVGVTFVLSVYVIHHEAMESGLHVGDALSPNSRSRSVIASFPIVYDNLRVLLQPREGSALQRLRFGMGFDIFEPD